ncbi:MAG: hypothetical protein AABX95_04630 [Nanoarchaeota archaeon]
MNKSGKFGLGDNVIRTIIAIVAFGLVAYAGSAGASNSRLFEFDSDDISQTNEVAVSSNAESTMPDINRADSNNKKSKAIPMAVEPDSQTVQTIPLAIEASSGNFLFGVDGAEAIFWGTFNGTSNTLNGEVIWYGNPSVRRTGTGTYSPSGNSGTLSIHFVDPNNANDPGMNWTGYYDQDRWTINSTEYPSFSFSGKVFQAPY